MARLPPATPRWRRMALQASSGPANRSPALISDMNATIVQYFLRALIALLVLFTLPAERTGQAKWGLLFALFVLSIFGGRRATRVHDPEDLPHEKLEPPHR